MKRSLFRLLITGVLAGSATTLAQSATSGGSHDLYGPSDQHADLNSSINAGNVGSLKLAWEVKTNDPVSHTPLMQNGKVYFADWGGDVYGVDAQTGKVAWKQTKLENVQKDWPWHGFAGTGALGDGKLFEASVEGNAYALDAQSGKVLWTKDLVQKPMNGVAVWNAFALDADTGTLFFATGNNYTGDPSANSDSMFAVDAKTGDTKWSKQIYNQDVWVGAMPIGPDFDFAGGPQLFSATVNGQAKKLVGAGNKSGFFFAFDRDTGDTVWQAAVGYGGVNGGMQSEGSVGDGRVYIWGNDSWAAGDPPEKHKVDIKAVDAGSGKYLWSQPAVQPAAASASFLASDVLFMPSLDGKVRGYSAKDGQLIWTSQQHPSVGSSVNVADGMLLFGAGVPKPFGFHQGNGVFAYQLGK